MSDRGSLPGCSRGSDRSRSAHLTRSSTLSEAPADLPRNVKLASGKRSCPRDGVPGPIVDWSFRLEDPEHTFRAVRCPRRDDPTFDFAQRLWRTHTQSLTVADDRFVQ